jgi:hypothetical protein
MSKSLGLLGIIGVIELGILTGAVLFFVLNAQLVPCQIDANKFCFGDSTGICSGGNSPIYSPKLTGMRTLLSSTCHFRYLGTDFSYNP